VRVLFGALHFTYFRNYDSVVRALAGRGHEVLLVADESEALGGQALVERLADAYPNVRWAFAPSRDDWRWTPLARSLRFALEYVRFQDPRYDATPKYRLRLRLRAPRAVRWLLERTPCRGARTRGALARTLAWLERGVPTHPGLDRLIDQWRPDAVLLASVTNPGSLQLDHLKSARRRGVPAVAAVWSWDHLSGKAWLRLPPDQLFVWNETQRREAVELHGFPGERVVVTGAQCYDQWFGRRPSQPRAAFLEAAGLDPARPLVTYVCSVLVKPAPSEAAFVREWLRRLRASDDARLRAANVLVRPHPERMAEWETVDLDGLGPVIVSGRNPIDEAARTEYFDALAHADAVVGLVTSAFLEAAVAGRAVLTLQLDDFRLHQDGTPHFRYLVGDEGLLHAAHDWDTHLAQLAAALADPDGAASRSRRFIDRFVRPHGAGEAATPRFVAAVEALADLAPAPAVYGAGLARAGAELGALALATPVLRGLVQSDREAADEEGSRARARHDAAVKARLGAEREARVDAKAKARAARLSGKADLRARKARAKAAREATRARALGGTRGVRGRLRQIMRLGQ
jgi:hypothetical protein